MTLEGIVAVRSCASAFDAELLAARLRASGIDATVEHQLVGLPYGSRGARVLVLEQDVDAATAEIGPDPEPSSAGHTPGETIVALWVAAGAAAVVLVLVVALARL